MESKDIETIDELFRWRLSANECQALKVNPISELSVEKKNKKATDKLGWNVETDVLYSFLLTYKLGLEIINETRVAEIKKDILREKGIPRLNNNSPMFLYRCSKDPAFTKLNESDEYKEFISLYFSLGNVIPIWPGGNEARGKKGIYDIPEIFFQTYRYWTEALITKYPNSCMDNILNDSFFVCRKAHKKKRITNKKNPDNTHSNRLSGYIYCADCGKKMGLVTQRKKDNCEFYYAFQCSQYRNSAMYGECESHYVNVEALEELILESIQKLSAHVLDDEEAFIEEVTQKCDQNQNEVEDANRREVESAKRRIEELNFMLKKLYEDNVSGKISDRQFTFLSTQYDSEAENLEQKIEELGALVIEEKSDKANPRKFIALIKKYTDITEITDDMLFEFIDKIYVHKVTGGRTRYRQQQIDIHFNFLGEYIPAFDEISEEERIAIIDAEHKARKRASAKKAQANQKERMRQLEIAANNGDQEAIEKLAYKKELNRQRSARANARLREARNADPEYIAKQEAKEQARILKVQEQERKRIERASRKKKEKRSELVARAKTDPEAMEELMALRAKEKVARDKKKAIQEARMAEDPEYAKEVIAKRKEYNRRHAERRKVKLADMKLRAEQGDEVAIKELAEYRQYFCEAQTRMRTKMYAEAEAGDPVAIERKEQYLKVRRDNYHAKKKAM